MANLDEKNKTETKIIPQTLPATSTNKIIEEKEEERGRGGEVMEEEEEEQEEISKIIQAQNIQTNHQQHQEQLNQLTIDSSNSSTTTNLLVDINNKQIRTTKKPPDILCNCPQKCDQRVPQDIRSSLYKEFCSLGDHIRQNAYLQSFIEMRSVYKRLWCQEERVGGRLQRRVSCKYKVPIEVPKSCLEAEQPSLPPKFTTNSKGQATIIVDVRDGCRTIEVCQKAFMNVYGITEKRIRLQREKLIARLRGDNPERHLRVGNLRKTSVTTSTNDDIHKYGTINNNNNSTIVNQTYSQSAQTCANDYSILDDEFTIVDTFFRNQLWKPEYIGIPTDKLQYLDMYYSNVIA